MVLCVTVYWEKYTFSVSIDNLSVLCSIRARLTPYPAYPTGHLYAYNIAQIVLIVNLLITQFSQTTSWYLSSGYKFSPQDLLFIKKNPLLR